jgi:hypothetical protein
MMALSDGIARIQKVNKVRKTRLVRSLLTAQDQARIAEEDKKAADQAKRRQENAVSEADIGFRSDPSSEQARIWKTVCNTRLADAAEQSFAAEQAAEEAKAQVHVEARAVRNHDLKASKIDDFAKKLSREAARLQEMKNEDDAVQARPQSTSKGVCS